MADRPKMDKQVILTILDAAADQKKHSGIETTINSMFGGDDSTNSAVNQLPVSQQEQKHTLA